jgi:hypothetical protein
MNERIKQLAEEAGFKPFDVREDDTKFKKFAELIVAECANQVSDLMDYSNYDHTDVYANEVELKALRQARQAIQEHFGLDK